MLDSQKIVIEARNVVARVSDNSEIPPLNLKLYQGECFGFLGPQGAGKSTLMHLLIGWMPIQSGSLFILDLDVREQARVMRSRVGIMTETDELDGEFSALENLLLFGHYHRIPSKIASERARGLLREIGLEDVADVSISELTVDQRRQLALCRALINDPPLIFLDNPTQDLSSVGKEKIWQILSRLKDQLGTSIILLSEQREEVERLCDRISLVHQGKLLQTGAPENLVQDIVGPEVLEFLCQRADLNYYLSRLRGRYNYQVIEDRVHLFLREDQEAKTAMSYVSGESLTIRRSSLDDVFLKLTGQGLKDQCHQ